MTVDNAASTALRQQLAEMERQRALQAKQKAAQDSRHFGEKVDPSYVDNDKVIDKDTFVKSAQIDGTDETSRAALYDKYNADGQDGLTDAEFDQAFSALEQPAGGAYEVQAGDSLSKIAGEKGGDPGRWQELYEANKDVIGDDPNMIQPGQQLRMPSGWGDDAATTEAKKGIDEAKIDPEKPTHSVPDRAEEMIQSDRVGDEQTVRDVQNKLQSIPADDPQRADYEQKAKTLEDGFKTKWGEGIDPASAKDFINTAKVEKMPMGPYAPGSQEKMKQDDQAILDTAETALKDVPEDQRAYYKTQVDKLKSDFNAKWEPQQPAGGTDPNDPCAVIDNAKIKPRPQGPYTDEVINGWKQDDLDALRKASEALDKVPADQKEAYETKVAAIRTAYQDKWQECPAY